ncbi:MAG: elongation factor 4 [bacterium]|nr:elongation factor 4 [bacterium]
MAENYIRNFCIIAHIDHGKSTLADRMLEATHTLSHKDMREQVLDNMDLERERGITIKAHAIQMAYNYDSNKYMLNLIDTPGHVDFSYEVSRSLAACEGALLLVDASQGVEAQTISNMYLAIEHDLEIIPVINKIDLPSAQIDMCKKQIIDMIGVDEDEILLASAKMGEGVEDLLKAIVERIPAPAVRNSEPLRALIFDSMFDPYRGAIAYIRVFDGEITEKDKIRFCRNDKIFEAEELGILQLKKQRTGKLSAGEVGYLISGAKDVKDTKVGDTVISSSQKDIEPLPGYREAKPMVFAGLYPAQHEKFEELRDSLDKLKLNDASLFFEPETSKALGFGFRCGFLGLLHMEIIQQRLEREYNLDLVSTIPNVRFRIIGNDGRESFLDNPANMPDQGTYARFEEPYITAQIITPNDYIGNIMKLAKERRAVIRDSEYVDKNRTILNFHFPLTEVVFDFYDRLKSMSRGYASFDYDFYKYMESDLVKLEILINSSPVDALSVIVHREKAYEWGRRITGKLKDLIPRHLFVVAIQASIGSKIIARETIRAMRKNVTAKCYGGDVTRKRKLLEKQKEGKKRMKQVGNVEIPQEAFLAVLKLE